MAGEAADRPRPAVPRLIALIGGIGHFEAAEIADILAHGERAVDMLAGGFIAVVLGAEPRGEGGETLGRLRRPPIPEPPPGREAAALIRAAGADSLADHRPDRAA